MSYFTDVKAKVKSIAQKSIADNNDIYTWEYIHNVGGLDIYENGNNGYTNQKLECLEVLGNIHENAELLKGGQ